MNHLEGDVNMFYLGSCHQVKTTSEEVHKQFVIYLRCYKYTYYGGIVKRKTSNLGWVHKILRQYFQVDPKDTNFPMTQKLALQRQYNSNHTS